MWQGLFLLGFESLRAGQLSPYENSLPSIALGRNRGRIRYFGHASRSPSTLAWQSAYILTVSVAQASTSRPVTPVSRSRPGQLESKFAGIGIAGDLGVEDAQAVSIKTRLQVHRAFNDLFQSDRDGAVFGSIG